MSMRSGAIFGVVSNFRMTVWRNVLFIFVACCVVGTLNAFCAH